MAEYRTDDDIYRVRLVYLGPSEYTLPVHLPYAQWGLYAALAAVFCVASWLLTGGLGWAPVAAAAAMPVTASVWRHVNPDRPAHLILRTVVRDWRRTRTDADEQRLPRLTARRIRFGPDPSTDEGHRYD
jgi:hypothetical protein